MVDVSGLDNQISNLKQEEGGYQTKLNQSPTALGGSEDPTGLDVSNQQALEKVQGEIQKLNDQRLSARWYPPQDQNPTEVSGGNPGIIGTALDYINRPCIGVAGAVKHFIGQGSGSLYQDVADNMARNKNDFGDILRTGGVPGSVAAPLGFALDIFSDPMSWLTMGSSAFIPRLALGAYKGATEGGNILKGISSAATSGALEKAVSVGRYTPFLRKSEAFANLGEKSLAATQKFEDLTGATAQNIVTQKGIGFGSYRVGLNDVINTIANATPGGRTFLKNFTYDPTEWVRQARMKDIIQRALGTGVDIRDAINAKIKGEPMEPFLKPIKAQAEETVASTVPSKAPFEINLDSPGADIRPNKELDLAMAKLEGTGLDQKMADAAPKIVGNVDDAAEIMKNPEPYISADPFENSLRIMNEEKLGGNEAITLEDLGRIVNSGALDETGVKWFDGMMKSIRKFEIRTGEGKDDIIRVGKNVMDAYDRAMGIFRVAKVGASPTSWMNAIVGNFIMTHMANGDIGPGFLNRLNQSWNMYKNKSGAAAFIDDLLHNSSMETDRLLHTTGDSDYIHKGLMENETATRGTLGTTKFIGANYNRDRLLMIGRDAGIIPTTIDSNKASQDIQAALVELKKVGNADIEQRIVPILPKDSKLITNVEGGTSADRKIMSEADKAGKAIYSDDISTGMLSREMFNQQATRRMFDHIAKKALEEDSNMAWKLLDFTFNKMSSGYQTIDQTYKMATIVRATVDGYTKNQLRRMTNIIDINPEELVKIARDGQWRYKLSPRSALELANNMYMNYAAMPAAIRVLRNLPLMGNPFISFMYGMALKTGQTIVYNPAAFNKVNFALTEFGGGKTPLEKKALDTKNYSYLKQPGFFRMPFFEKNPAYLNLSSIIPYYSLNMFNPPQYQLGGGTLPEELVQFVQNSPIIKDPLGSTLFDYFIQPMILGEATRPQGMFGQPLYPIDATLPEKIGYGTRSAIDAFMPNVAAYAGLIPGQEPIAEYIPSYRWRQIIRATQGKNQLGISGKEPAISRTIRSILSTSGISVQAPVNTTFNQGNPRKK